MSIVVKDLSYTYSPKSPYAKQALNGVDLTINEGDFLGIIGHTGSGKSTFIQHINGLIKLQHGEVKVFDIDLAQKRPKPDLRRLRSEVGMVFQYPEYQLFEETVGKDVAFGPKNIGVAKEEIEGRVKEALELVGLDYESVKDRSPFDLSGGQKRRAAIAGVIAMRPKVLVLDEPTAGLDPQGKEQILQLIMTLKEKCSPTIILISHDIDEISRFATRIVVFNKGAIAFDEPMEQLFDKQEQLKAMGLDVPLAVKLKKDLAKKGITLEGEVFNESGFVDAVSKLYNGKKKATVLKPKEEKNA